MKRRFHLLFFSHSKLAQCFSDECHGQSPADHCHMFRLHFLIMNSAHIPLEFKTCTNRARRGGAIRTLPKKSCKFQIIAAQQRKDKNYLPCVAKLAAIVHAVHKTLFFVFFGVNRHGRQDFGLV